MKRYSRFYTKTKKSQAESQIFIYIMVIVIAAGILIYGYKAIKGFRTQADDALYLGFETDIRHDLQSISYESTQNKKYSLPSVTEQVCFRAGNPEPGVDAAAVYAEGTANEREYGVIEIAVRNGVQENIFLYPKGGSPIFSGIILDLVETTGQKKFKCFDVDNGILNIKIKGQGSSVLIE